jgi:hypothetical protein
VPGPRSGEDRESRKVMERSPPRFAEGGIRLESSAFPMAWLPYNQEQTIRYVTGMAGCRPKPTSAQPGKCVRSRLLSSRMPVSHAERLLVWLGERVLPTHSCRWRPQRAMTDLCSRADRCRDQLWCDRPFPGHSIFRFGGWLVVSTILSAYGRISFTLAACSAQWSASQSPVQ